MHQSTYQITDKTGSRKLTEFLCREGQFLLPMVELITGAEMALNELIEVTGRVTRWRDGQMVLRWTASSLVCLEKRMRRIMGYQQLWILEAKLQDQNQEQEVAKKLTSA
jgi:hypothetical protein